jgi:hypothetical protein
MRASSFQLPREERTQESGGGGGGEKSTTDLGGAWAFMG